MAVKIKSENGVMTAIIHGDIDHHTAKEIRETIDERVERENPSFLKLDFGSVNFMDSSGIGLIMGRFKLMGAQKNRMKVINLPFRLERMIKLSGLMMLINFENEQVDLPNFPILNSSLEKRKIIPFNKTASANRTSPYRNYGINNNSIKKTRGEEPKQWQIS